ncbi:sulfite exporter TauE/SafE family protein [Paracoccus tegillarcae]|uniref:Probable membrane transporter protein n=1 Tax=Paracoccus tegillarcae TaxID=1529068 RepID=A0A2K9ECJ3_9RHOB|nr:sulfite exporter TauE/SafE family protein [Paracoccus tegillarcae]AUH32643.1 sulfite exporter TauE/SafE family protein [Paracoccus tegillarcae]
MVEGLMVAMIAFALGGILKGAIGAGTPVIVIPLMSIYFDVPYAVSVFVLPALLSNIWQGWQYRHALLDRGFVIRLAIGAAIGALIGSILLASLPSDFLSITVGVLALCYIGFRLAKPDWQLDYGLASRIVLPVGVMAGILQGAAGISAPVSMTFLHALKLSRPQFIATISVLFSSMAMVQLPTLTSLGVLDGQRFLISMAACIPLFLGMPVGAWLVRHVQPKVFDRLIMILLFVIAVGLILESL